MTSIRFISITLSKPIFYISKSCDILDMRIWVFSLNGTKKSITVEVFVSSFHWDLLSFFKKLRMSI